MDNKKNKKKINQEESVTLNQMKWLSVDLPQ